MTSDVSSDEPEQFEGKAAEDSDVESGTPTRLKLSLKKKLIFSAIASLLVLGSLELCLRIVGLPSGLLRTLSKLHIKDKKTFDATLGMWKPSFKGHVGWPAEIAYDVETNSLGMRGPEVSKPKKGFRILCIGDSTTFSVYVNNPDTYPRQLEKRLKKDFPEIEVLNGGHPAWSTRDELDFLRERAIKCKPDLIIHMFCDNDPSDIHPDPTQGRFQRHKADLDKGESLTDQLRFYTGIGELMTRVQLGMKVWRNKRREFRLDPPEINAELWQRYESTYQELAKFCREQNVPLISTAFPQIKESADVKKRSETVVAGISKKYGVPFIATAAAFREAEAKNEKLYWLPIDSHANVKGNSLLAETIYRAMKAEKLGPYGK